LPVFTGGADAGYDTAAAILVVMDDVVGTGVGVIPK
jgi:hypothetical protein